MLGGGGGAGFSLFLDHRIEDDPSFLEGWMSVPLTRGPTGSPPMTYLFGICGILGLAMPHLRQQDEFGSNVTCEEGPLYSNLLSLVPKKGVMGEQGARPTLRM